jgi:coatomer subunit beta'
VDGERLPLAAKDLGSCDLYPQTLVHNPNGRFVTVCGDGEFIIYTALAWRNKAFGPAEEFVWGEDSSVYATRYVPTPFSWAIACSSSADECCNNIYLRLPAGIRISYPLQCREGSTQVKIFRNFKEVAQVRPGFSIEAIYGGALLGIAGADFIAFYDWTTATVSTLHALHPVP